MISEIKAKSGLEGNDKAKVKKHKKSKKCKKKGKKPVNATLQAPAVEEKSAVFTK
jgi:hypothetical protein